MKEVIKNAGIVANLEGTSSTNSDAIKSKPMMMQQTTAAPMGPTDDMLVPQTKGIMPRLNKTTNPAKKKNA